MAKKEEFEERNSDALLHLDDTYVVSLEKPLAGSDQPQRPSSQSEKIPLSQPPAASLEPTVPATSPQHDPVPEQPPQVVPFNGQQIGNYHLLRKIGRGGFATVYLGEHRYLKTHIAVKILHETHVQEDARIAFIQEAQVIARLKHHNIVRVLDFGIEPQPFLVMDYAPGGTLRDRYPYGTRLAPMTVLPYVRQIAAALHYAHQQKMVHRDVKPENMLLETDGTLLLSDFGIAVVAHQTISLQVQETSGTAAYMAPEHIRGMARPASDQYSLAVVIYEWLCGRRPFVGKTFVETVTQHLLNSPPSLRSLVPELSPSVEQVVLTALAKEPKQRFATVQAFATAFEQACQL